MKQSEPKKLWGWKDGEFGKSLPKTIFKSGFKPKVAFDPPEGKDPKKGTWVAGKWIEFDKEVTK